MSELSPTKSRQIARIINGPHLLFIGANGNKTFGITVEAINPEENRKKGYSTKWDINENTIFKANNVKEALGLTETEEKELKETLQNMMEKKI